VVHIAVSVLKQTENSQFQDVVELLGVSQKITRCLQKIPDFSTLYIRYLFSSLFVVGRIYLSSQNLSILAIYLSTR
jgi:hypothetical protein